MPRSASRQSGWSMTTTRCPSARSRRARPPSGASLSSTHTAGPPWRDSEARNEMSRTSVSSSTNVLWLKPWRSRSARCPSWSGVKKKVSASCWSRSASASARQRATWPRPWPAATRNTSGPPRRDSGCVRGHSRRTGSVGRRPSEGSARQARSARSSGSGATRPVPSHSVETGAKPPAITGSIVSGSQQCPPPNSAPLPSRSKWNSTASAAQCRSARPITPAETEWSDQPALNETSGQSGAKLAAIISRSVPIAARLQACSGTG